MKSPHLDPEWLRAMYVDECLSTYDIGKIVGRDPKRIYEKLVDFGIPTRPRGMNLKGSDNFMQSGNPNPFAGRTHSDETRAVLSAKASVPKPYLRGKRNGMSGRTGDTNPRYIDGSSPERQRLYASGEWKEILRAVYARDDYVCQRCGSPNTGKRGIHAHHFRSWAGNASLRFEMDNLIVLCRACHEWVHSKQNVDRDYLHD